MTKKIFITNLILLFFIVTLDILYMCLGGLLIKGITSAIFVFTGGVNLYYVLNTDKHNVKFCYILLIGLIFAMLGDIFLNIEFIIGAILFAIGHVFFFISYCTIEKFKWSDLLYSVVIFVPSVLLITLAPFFEFDGLKMELICILYALVISIMVGKAFALELNNHSKFHFVILIGSILFFFSDLMLLLNVFGDAGKWASILCLATYYPAEFLLAFSIFMSQAKNSNYVKIKNR